MGSDANATLDEAASSFLAFARSLVLKLSQWESEAGPPLFDYVDVKFVEHGRISDIVRRLDYERFFRRRWDPSSAEIKELARDCVRLHLDRGLVKPPPLADHQGIPLAAPSFEEILPSLVWAVARPVLLTIDKLQTLQVPDAEFIDTYRRFVEGWCMADVPQSATVPLLNFVAETSLKITPYFELVPFTPADKNLLFSRTAILDSHREPDHSANFKLAGQFSNDTTRPVHFGTIAYETGLAIMAMRLLKAGDVGARMMYYRSSLEHEEFTGGSGLHSLALNAGGFGHLGNAASRLLDATQGDQKHARLVVIFQRSAEVLGGKFGILAQFTNYSFLVGYARLAFHSVLSR
jgi:hypothetical protein